MRLEWGRALEPCPILVSVSYGARAQCPCPVERVENDVERGQTLLVLLITLASCLRGDRK